MSELIFERGRPGRRGTTLPKLDVPDECNIPDECRRTKKAEFPEVSELDLVRHYVNLSRMNMGIDTCFYPLGSCTMKYNPKLNEQVARLPGFANLHPLLPQLRSGSQLTQGALAVIYEMEMLLCELLGFVNFTMQPLAGSHGELTGIMMMAAYHKKNSESTRDTLLIPDAAHGTNPASAAIAGFKVKVLPSDEHGNVDLENLKEHLNDSLAGIMLTCPNTLGLFDPNTKEICQLVHDAGGLCYGDGANLNAIIGRVRPGDLGFDCMHVNLHKTFSTPHGGGGPGSGVVGVNETLKPFLPVSRVTKRPDGAYHLNYNFPDSIGYIAAFYGNFGMILRAYAYSLSLGHEGLKRVSENAVINANYIRSRLKDAFDLPYDRTCMHECVLSAKTLAKEHEIHALDIAKGLLDAGFHPPTIYFPLIVPECLMIEPTETESKETLDLFIDAVLKVLEEGKENPEKLHAMPRNFPVTRLNETRAAREPNLASLS
ncbi:MAG: aminomethyl-transferring glycine dehydrogenase subunit GcvPB [Lentisphaeria bacterium]|nr:aminomethyl-transferring glycine dehydrogenase subunit GcvPB [Lentisphaeria bacterium]